MWMLGMPVRAVRRRSPQRLPSGAAVRHLAVAIVPLACCRVLGIHALDGQSGHSAVANASTCICPHVGLSASSTWPGPALGGLAAASAASAIAIVPAPT